MNFNVYLPDDLGQRAKDADLKLSRLLRSAVTRELARREAMSETLGEPTLYEVEMEEDGFPYVGRIEGKLLAEAGIYAIYLAVDGRVIAYQPDDKFVTVLDDPGEDLVNQLAQLLPVEFLLPVCRKLGLRPVIDL